jgi:AhpD family alkylhydroperoxidase
LAALYDKLLADRGVVPYMFKTVANVPPLALGFAAFLKPLFTEGSLQPWYKELVATRVASLNDCPYLIASHGNLARTRGASGAQVESLGEFEAGPFTEKEKAGFRYADKLHTSAHAIDDRDSTEIKKHFTDGELVELTAVAAAFEFFSRFVCALEIPTTPPPK